MHIPSFVYNDLYDPSSSTYKVYLENGVTILTFRGGDGAGAYNAKLFFRNGLFLKRELHDSIVPENVTTEDFEKLSTKESP